jgi:hypothetical protein
MSSRDLALVGLSKIPALREKKIFAQGPPPTISPHLKQISRRSSLLLHHSSLPSSFSANLILPFSIDLHNVCLYSLCRSTNDYVKRISRFSLRRLALRAARQTSIASSTRPLSTVFKPSTFTVSSSRPKNLSELRSFESLLQIRYNSTDAPIDTPTQFTNPEHKSADGADLTPAKTVYVGNVQFDATPETLGEEFKRFGEVRGAKIIYDSRGLSKGYVFCPLEC